MSKYLVFKFIAIGIVELVLLVALSMVDNLVSARKAYRDVALRSIADGAAGPQQLNGPVWVLPYRWQSVSPPDETGKRETKWVDGELHVLPEKLIVNGQLHTFARKRDIYQALLYNADLRISGSFKLPANGGLSPDAAVEWGLPYLAVGLSDMRGIKQSPSALWGEDKLVVAFQPGTRLKSMEQGMHALLPSYDGKAATVDFDFHLNVGGMDQFSVMPLGRDTEVSLGSNWASPSFVGRFLPDDRHVGNDGFNARWRTSWFATNLNEQFDRCFSGSCDTFNGNALSVRMIDPVDVYAQTDRAVKYGFLFISLTFATFFLTEVMRRIAIHPIQYGLVGLSLAIFFLLLLSLAEQLPFYVAYLSAAVACVVQNLFYGSYALGGRKAGLAYGSLLATLYGVLYLLLCVEDFALLCGSILLFALLTVAMVLTRKVDWYQLTGSSDAAS